MNLGMLFIWDNGSNKCVIYNNYFLTFFCDWKDEFNEKKNRAPTSVCPYGWVSKCDKTINWFRQAFAPTDE